MNERPMALPEEATDLGIHVRMCGMRHDQVLRSIQDHAEATERRLGRIERAVWGVIGILAMTVGTAVPQLLPIVRAMAGQ